MPRSSSHRTTADGLAFLKTAFDAMPSTLGDRVRTKAMCDALELAIRCRFAFDPDDAVQLNGRGHCWEEDYVRGLGINTGAGIFAPLREVYYAQACFHGGTYARMWEAHHGMKPWTAPRVLHQDGGGRVTEMGRNRLAHGFGIELPAKDPQAGGPATHRWWCSSFDAAHITLCRYSAEPTYPRRPIERMKLDRAQWKALVDGMPEGRRQEDAVTARAEAFRHRQGLEAPADADDAGDAESDHAQAVSS